jgi:hypothetical protein
MCSRTVFSSSACSTARVPGRIATSFLLRLRHVRQGHQDRLAGALGLGAHAVHAAGAAARWCWGSSSDRSRNQRNQTVHEIGSGSLDTPLEITTDGRSLQIRPVRQRKRPGLKESLDWVNKHHAGTLKKLAK